MGKGLKNSFEFLLQIEYQRLFNTLHCPVCRTLTRVKNSTEPLHLVMFCLKKKVIKKNLKGNLNNMLLKTVLYLALCFHYCLMTPTSIISVQSICTEIK